MSFTQFLSVTMKGIQRLKTQAQIYGYRGKITQINTSWHATRVAIKMLEYKYLTII